MGLYATIAVNCELPEEFGDYRGCEFQTEGDLGDDSDEYKITRDGLLVQYQIKYDPCRRNTGFCRLVKLDNVVRFYTITEDEQHRLDFTANFKSGILQSIEGVWSCLVRK